VDVIAMLSGWPALMTALLSSAAGVWLGKPILAWAGVVLVAPVALYLSGSPAYPMIGTVPVIAVVSSALTCRRPRKWPGIAGVSIYALFLAALADIVVSEP
jgi:hypothetical protein